LWDFCFSSWVYMCVWPVSWCVLSFLVVFSVVSCCFVFALVFFRWSLDPGHSSSASPEYHLSDLISEQPVWGPWTTTTSVLPVRKLVF
jgi:hypothetical protein